MSSDRRSSLEDTAPPLNATPRARLSGHAVLA